MSATTDNNRTWQTVSAEVVRALIIAMFGAIGSYWAMRSFATPPAQVAASALLERVSSLEARQNGDDRLNTQVLDEQRAIRRELADLNSYLRSRR